MAPVPNVPGYEDLVADLRSLRRHGLPRLRRTHLPALSSAARLTRPPGDGGSGSGEECRPAELEGLLRRTADALQGNLADAAAYVFGLAPGTRDWPVGDRRRRAAQVYGVSTERFRKHHEPLIISELADRLGELCRRPPAGPAAGAPGMPQMPGTMRLTGLLGGRPLQVTLHAMPVELVVGVDIIVSPGNMHLELPQAFKDSVSASLRRAGAHVSAIGEVLDDAVQRELSAWMRAYARPGLPVAPGTVAPTGPGQLRAAGIRRIYHAAVAAPRLRGGGYDVSPGAVTGAVRNVFKVAAAESREYAPPLRSVCLPLLGAGRGGLPPATSFTWIWAALDRAVGTDDWWDLHFVARSAPAIEAIVRGVGRRP